MKRWLLLFVCLAAAWVPSAWGHVGSKDVFETVHAGPYTLFVTIRPPDVIPGVATVEVRSSGALVSSLEITPLPLTGEAAKHPPVADPMQASRVDPAFFTGGVWMMSAGTWQVRLRIDGPSGVQTASVPVLAVPLATLHMQRGMGLFLGACGLLLVLSAGSIAAAAVRESRLRPGVAPTPVLRRRGFVALGATLAVLAVAVTLGDWWWNVEAASYARNVYTRPVTTATLSGGQLDLHIASFDPDAKSRFRFGRQRSNDDYLPDHGKLIHLYAIRFPEMDAAFHLHPELVAPGDFRMNLPALPPGTYRLYGDVVHRNGFPETLLASVTVPAGLPAAPLAADDAGALPPPISAAELPATYHLPDGYTMVWGRPALLTASTPYTFHFHLLDPAGRPAADVQPYLGMAGHAAFVRTDGSVFAHTHPEGSVAMADLMLADTAQAGAGSMAGMAASQSIGPDLDFPYGFPAAGRYRIFIQMKHGGVVETGVFDAEVQGAK